jgi:hypothetical protein
VNNHPVQCQCGAIQGQIDLSGTHTHVLCYCTDCRAFAHYLGKTEMLDPQGGTEIVQIAQFRLRFLQGTEHLAAIRLSKTGMIRWYATCCGAPIGNTMADPRGGFIGMIYTCLDQTRISQDFGANVATFNTQTAMGEPKPKQRGVFGVLARFLWIVITTLLSGRYKHSPLFDDAGSPRVTPRILNPEELENLKRAATAAG